MTLTEKAAYLKGLAEGLSFDKTSPEGKLLAAIVDFCSELAEEVVTVTEYCEELDEDLGEVEELLIADDDDFDDDFDDYDDEDEDWEDEAFYEIECPNCGELVMFDESIEPENLTCPACHKTIATNISDLEAEDGVTE